MSFFSTEPGGAKDSERLFRRAEIVPKENPGLAPGATLCRRSAASHRGRIFETSAFTPGTRTTTPLLRAPLETLGEHGNLEYRLGVVPDSLKSCEFLAIRSQGSAADHVERFLVGSRKGDADDVPRRRNHAEVFSVRAEHLNASSRRDVKTPGRVDCHTVTVAAGFELCEISPVFERAVRQPVECDDNCAV